MPHLSAISTACMRFASAPMLDELDLGHAIFTTVREVVVDLCGFSRFRTRTSGS